MTNKKRLGTARPASPVGTLLAVLGLLLATPAVSVLAADKLTAQNCAQLTNRAARLACFDQIFGSAKPAEPAAAKPAPEEPAAPEAPSATAEPAAAASQSPVAESASPTESAAKAAQEEGDKELRVEDLVITTAPGKVQSEPEAPTEPAAQSAPQQGSGGILSRKAKVNFKSAVKALRARDKQRMVFLLENGEVWMQSAPRNLPIKEGDDVTIKSGLMGGYIMRTGKGVSTRVNRIK